MNYDMRAREAKVYPHYFRRTSGPDGPVSCRYGIDAAVRLPGGPREGLAPGLHSYSAWLPLRCFLAEVAFTRAR